MLRHQARLTHGAVRTNVDGLTHEDSLLQPQPGGNCLNWVVGHLLFVDQRMLRRLGQTPVMSDLHTLIFHQAYHAGQTGILRRLAGKEGAIR